MVDSPPFWEQPEQVERFASRPPDERLLDLLQAYEVPDKTRVLDLGCAGGRNTVVLAERGFDFWAIDSSQRMVEHCRRRVAEVVGGKEADRRVMVGKMHDLNQFDPESLDMVVSLGVYHNASSRAEWDLALAETARVVRPEGPIPQVTAFARLERRMCTRDLMLVPCSFSKQINSTPRCLLTDCVQ